MRRAPGSGFRSPGRMATKKRKRSALKRIRQTERRTVTKQAGRSAARTAGSGGVVVSRSHTVTSTGMRSFEKVRGVAR